MKEICLNARSFLKKQGVNSIMLIIVSISLTTVLEFRLNSKWFKKVILKYLVWIRIVFPC